MTARERVEATLRGTHRDHLANQPLLMSFAVAYHGVPYWEYVSDYRVLVAAQLRAAEDFGVDVVTCCSDAWREASDLGAELTYYDHEPPGCTQPLLKERADLTRLQPVEPEAGPRMIDRILAVSDLADAAKGRAEVDGWVEGPVSQAANLRGLTELMLDTKDDPGFVDDLMDWVTDLEIAFARAQIRAGADVVGVGDAASSLLPPAFYQASSPVFTDSWRPYTRVGPWSAFTSVAIRPTFFPASLACMPTSSRSTPWSIWRMRDSSSAPT